MQVSNVMTREPKMLPSNLSIRDGAMQMRELDVGLLPVFENNRLVGVVTDRDLVVRAMAEGLDPTETPLSKVMSPDIVACYEDDDVEIAATYMQQRSVRRVVVLDRENHPVGIVSLGDLSCSECQQKAGEVLGHVSRAPGQR